MLSADMDQVGGGQGQFVGGGRESGVEKLWGKGGGLSPNSLSKVVFPP